MDDAQGVLFGDPIEETDWARSFDWLWYMTDEDIDAHNETLAATAPEETMTGEEQ